MALRVFKGFKTQRPLFANVLLASSMAEFQRLLLYMVSFKNDSETVEQTCTRLKTRELGDPPISKHNARMVSFKSTHMLSSKLAQAAGLGGAAAPHSQTHHSHGEWRGFQNDSD